LPKGQKCLKKGHYCGTYVWLRDGGQDELTKLTMTILDYAFSSQAPKAPSKPKDPEKTKEVTWFFDKNGDPVAQEGAAQIIKATVPFDAVVRLSKDAKLPLDNNPEKRNAADVKKERVERDPVDRAFNTSGNASGSNAAPDGEPRFLLPPIQPQRTGISPLELELQLRNPQGGSNSQ
jgi:hypothetical protein